MKNYLRNALRYVFRDPVYSCINISGLAVGMVCGIFIFLFVIDELSYDTYHKDAHRIYRVVTEFVNEEGNRSFTAATAPAIGPLLQKELPEVESATRIFPTNRRKTLFHFGEKSFYEDRMYDADSGLFHVFSFPFIKGNPETALSMPDAVVFTETTAKKYFGDVDAIGQVVTVEDQYLGVKDLVVTAVLKDIPFNSHFKFDILRPARYMITESIEDSWGFAAFHTYVKLKEGSLSGNVDDKIQGIIQRYNPENKSRYYTQPLTKIHLHSELEDEIEPNGSFTGIAIMITLAVFIIVVAAINYINLATAQAIHRAKEVGVRKVSGASKSALIRQFLGESVFTAFTALGVALMMALALLPTFNQLTGKHFFYTLGGDIFLWAGILSVALLAGILSGIYPALYLSSFSPVKVLRNNIAENKGSWELKSVLVSIQFITSIGLIICSAVIIKQMDFVQSARLGFDQEHVIVIPDVYEQANQAALRQRLLQNPQVINTGASSGMIDGTNWTGKMHTRHSKNEISIHMCNIDTGFLKTMGMELASELKLSPSDSVAGLIINETAAKEFGFSAPVGEEVFPPNDVRPLKIAGVVKDFHFASLHEKITPFVFQVLDQFRSNLFIRIKSSDMQETLANIEAEWKNVAPDRPFQYFFLDDHIEKLYQSEMRFKTFFLLSTFVAMFIASLGLFGLTALTVKEKTKEIGIRKVLGASASHILVLLTKNLLLIILASNVIALPVAYFAMENWLTHFAYRIELGSNLWIFLLPPIAVVSLAIITMSLLTVRAAQANPVKALRSE